MVYAAFTDRRFNGWSRPCDSNAVVTSVLLKFAGSNTRRSRRRSMSAF